MIRGIKNVRKLWIKKNIFSTKNGSYHLNRFYVFVPVDVVKDLGNLEIYFKSGVENLKKIAKNYRKDY